MNQSSFENDTNVVGGPLASVTMTCLNDILPVPPDIKNPFVQDQVGFNIRIKLTFWHIQNVPS